MCSIVLSIENGRFKKGGEPTPIFILGTLGVAMRLNES